MNIVYIIDIIGVLGPYITLILTTILLVYKQTYFNIFLLASAVNIILNIILKLWFKEPRPTDDKKILEIAINNNNRILFDNYGMPSLHSQLMLFTLTYILLVYNSPYLTLLYGLLTVNTILQRFKYNNHTFYQLFIGAIVGAIIGVISYVIAYFRLMGEIKQKPDDNAVK